MRIMSIIHSFLLISIPIRSDTFLNGGRWQVGHFLHFLRFVFRFYSVCPDFYFLWLGMNTGSQVNIQSVYVKLRGENCRCDYRIQSEKVGLFDDKQRACVY